MVKKKLPIGISDFRKVIEENYYYVDKSLLIKELVDGGSGTILLPRPRRFGKTLNLSMLRYFYEIAENDTSGLFQQLAIWQQGDSYTRHQGTYPVIFLTFKDIKSEIWQECFEKLKDVISKEYLRHKHILNSGQMDDYEKKVYRDIIELTASNSAYENSLVYLSVYLERYYKQKTVILIDEYDTPIQQGYIQDYYKEVTPFMRNLLSGALKDNNSLEKGVLTGILRVAKESIFSGLNNLQVSSLLHPRFGSYFGLLEHEVEEMLQYYEADSKTEEVKGWYNGYVFGDSTIYNPWSIINYADNWQIGLQPYWVNTSSNDLVKQIIARSNPKVKEELESLLRGGSILKEINDNIVFGEIENNSETLWSFLLMSGYLKKNSQVLLEGITTCELSIPNKEVAGLYRQIVREWFREGTFGHQYEQMLQGLLEGDMETFEPLFQEIVMNTLSYFDLSGKRPENVYHSFVLGLLVSLGDQYEVKSNRESGYGRYDVMLIPRDLTKKGIIIEFKKVNALKKETLQEAVQQALQQIERKQYEQELRARGITNFLKIAMAFDGKEVSMGFIN